jgi:hypothetical protein
MRTDLTNRYLSFLLILLMHIALIFIWLGTSPSQKKITPNKQTFFLIALPQQKPVAKVTQQKPFIKPKSISSITLSSKKPILSSEASTTDIQTPTQTQIQTPEPGTAVSPATLQKDIRALSLSLKDDFLKQEKNYRPDGKSSSENMKKFSNTLAGVVQSRTEGTVIEKKFAYDGRPVSKIKTPFGTHCVRHPKAGEKLELSPPPLPVSCGEL